MYTHTRAAASPMMGVQDTNGEGRCLLRGEGREKGRRETGRRGGKEGAVLRPEVKKVVVCDLDPGF